MIVADNLCHALEQTPILEDPKGQVPGVTASIGVASVTCTKGIEFEDLLKMADKALTNLVNKHAY